MSPFDDLDRTPREPYPEDLVGIEWFDHLPAEDRPDAHARLWRTIWAEKGGNTLPNTKEAREEVAWRLLRRLAWMRGVLRNNERLSEIDRLIDPHDSSFVHVEDQQVARRIPRDLLPYMERGMALIPATGSTAPAEQTANFVELVRTLGERLGLNQRRRTAPGFALIASTRTFAHAWPPLDDLVQFEGRLIATVKKELVGKTTSDVMEAIESERGMNEDEAIGLVSMALRALEAGSHLEDHSGQKARVLSKLEQQAKMAEDAFDHRGAAVIQREWWRVFRDEGRVDAEDFEEMSLVVQRAALNRRTGGGGSGHLPQLPEPDDDDFDEDL